jgi:hypothetical protein
MNLIEALNNENSDELQKRIRLLGMSAKDCPTRKGDRVEYLRAYLLSAELNDQIARMTGAEQTMVAEVVHNQSGCVDQARLLARYGSIPTGYLQKQAGYWSQRYERSEPKRVKSLLGLIFYRQCIPTELRDRLAKLLPRPEEDRVAVTAGDALPATVEGARASGKLPVYRRNMELAAHQDLYTVLRLIDQGRISVSEKTHVASAASMNRISAELYEGEFFSAEDEDQGDVYKDRLSPIRAYAWPLLVQTGGLAKRAGNKLQLSTKGKQVLQRKIPFAETIAELYRRWRDKGKIDEFRRINRIKGQTRRGRGYKGSQMTLPEERRNALELQLQRAPAGEWIQVDEWFRYMQSSGEQFEVTGNPWALYLVDAEYGSLGYGGFHDFSILQGRYTLAYLFEYLATLGMIDVAYSAPHGARSDYHGNWGADEYGYLSRYDGLGWFRLNALGAFSLGMEDEYRLKTPEMPPLLRTIDELEFLLLRAPEPHERMLLEQYATISKNQLQLDTVRALRAIEQGGALVDLISLLRQQTKSRLTVEVEDFLDDLETRTTSIRDGGSARIIECASESLARLVAESGETGKYCFHAGGRRVVVVEKSWRNFLNGLRKLGYVLSADSTVV